MASHFVDIGWMEKFSAAHTHPVSRRNLRAVIAVGLAALASTAAFATVTDQAQAATKPNIVVIMADDQRQDDMPVMTKLKAALADTGTTFQNSYVSYSLCCPSRTSFLTGQFMHNHDITWNFWPEGGYFKFKHQSTNYDPSKNEYGGWGNILPKWLQNSGYRTGLIGKYLNQTGEKDPSKGYADSGKAKPTEIPPGWSEWAGGVDPTTYSYYGYTLNVNKNVTPSNPTGKLIRYGSCERVTFANKPTKDPLAGCKVTSQKGKDGTQYQTDVEATYSEDFIKRNSDTRKRTGAPFFLWVTPTAPHTTTPTGASEGLPAVPPNRYANLFATRALPVWPAMDEADVSDKPALDKNLAWFPRIGAGGKELAKRHYRGRLGAVKGVDDLVGRVVKTLKDNGQLNNTIIIYTSDNGWLLGEHRLVAQKFFGFEPSIRVPLVISGPGFNNPANRRVVSEQAVNVDLAPTILQAAGATAGRPLDGVPLQDLIANPSSWTNRSWAVETGPNPRSAYYSGVHNRRYHLEVIVGGGLPTRYELYDLQADPNEMNSVAKDPRYADVLEALKTQAATLARCKGDGGVTSGGTTYPSCRDNPASFPEPKP